MAAESIFADIFKQYEYSSQHKREKVERRDQEEENRYKVKEEDYLRNYQALIPYAGQGTFMYNVLTRNSLRSLVYSCEYDNNRNVFLATKDDIEAMQNKGLKFIEGKTSYGQKYWTSDVGLVFQIHTKQKYGFSEIEGIRYPDLDWLIQSLSSMEFLQYNPTYLMDELLMYKNRDIIEADRQKQQDHIAKEGDRAANLALEMLGAEQTEINRQLLRFATNYDFTIEYSDDNLKCMRYRAMEQRFHELAKEHAPVLIQFLSDKISNYHSNPRPMC